MSADQALPLVVGLDLMRSRWPKFLKLSLTAVLLCLAHGSEAPAESDIHLELEPGAGGPFPAEPGIPGPPELSVRSPRWFDLAAATAERDTLAAGFTRRGYEPPRSSFVLAARIERGAGQPAFAYLSRGDDGFVSSAGKFGCSSQGSSVPPPQRSL